MIFETLESELFRFKFHSLSYKILEFSEFNLNILYLLIRFTLCHQQSKPILCHQHFDTISESMMVVDPFITIAMVLSATSKIKVQMRTTKIVFANLSMQNILNLTMRWSQQHVAIWMTLKLKLVTYVQKILVIWMDVKMKL